MTEPERQKWAAFDKFSLLQADADAARASRTQRNKQLKRARLAACAWERNLRTVYYSLFMLELGLYI